jgi:hypothetical protein
MRASILNIGPSVWSHVCPGYGDCNNNLQAVGCEVVVLQTYTHTHTHTHTHTSSIVVPKKIPCRKIEIKRIVISLGHFLPWIEIIVDYCEFFCQVMGWNRCSHVVIVSILVLVIGKWGVGTVCFSWGCLRDSRGSFLYLYLFHRLVHNVMKRWSNVA